MICVCVSFLHILYNVLMDKGSLNIYFYNFYSAFYNEDCEEIVMVLIFLLLTLHNCICIFTF